MKKSFGAKTIVFPTPVFIIGTYDKENHPNAMAVAWGGICCSEPPCVAISVRKATYTYGSLIERKAFTISIPSQDYVKQADYLGSVSGRNEDKFTAASLTPVKSEIVDAPYVNEFPLILECSVLHVIEIGLHTQFIGQIKDIKVDEDMLTPEGLPDIEKIKPFTFNPATRTYYTIGQFLAPAFSVGKSIKK